MTEWKRQTKPVQQDYNVLVVVVRRRRRRHRLWLWSFPGFPGILQDAIGVNKGPVRPACPAGLKHLVHTCPNGRTTDLSFYTLAFLGVNYFGRMCCDTTRKTSCSATLLASGHGMRSFWSGGCKNKILWLTFHNFEWAASAKRFSEPPPLDF